MKRHSIKVAWIMFVALVFPCAGGRVVSAAEREALTIAEKKPPVSNAMLKDAVYSGTQSCKECHAKEFESWSQTWHSRMLRKVAPDIVVADFNNVELTYSELEVTDANKQKIKISPTIQLKREGESFQLILLDKDHEANNQSYSLAYVLGGHWEQQFEVPVGDTYYPSPMRWVVDDQQWRTKAFSEIWWVADGTPDGRPRKPEEMQKNQVSDAKCDGCHTAGLKTVKEGDRWTLPDRDKGLGIGCEKCHGPGSKHMEAKTRESILNPARLNAVQQDQVCGQCHSRVTSKAEPDLAYPLDFLPGNTDLQERVEFWTYSTKPGNFWPNGDANKNRQQYHDVQKTKHARAGVTCITCHSAHAPVPTPAQMRVASDGACRQCHVQAARMYDGSPMSQADVSCTACHMAKIANRAGSTRKSKEHWDVSAHTFDVIMPVDAESWKMKSSCDACHAGEEKARYGEKVLQYEREVRAKIEEVRGAMEKKPGSIGALKAGQAVSAVLLDGSYGGHHYRKTVEALSRALKDAKRGK
jgi:hypothetical protein